MSPELEAYFKAVEEWNTCRQALGDIARDPNQELSQVRNARAAIDYEAARVQAAFENAVMSTYAKCASSSGKKYIWKPRISE